MGNVGFVYFVFPKHIIAQKNSWGGISKEKGTKGTRVDN
jgi:hypothetical protein